MVVNRDARSRSATASRNSSSARRRSAFSFPAPSEPVLLGHVHQRADKFDDFAGLIDDRVPYVSDEPHTPVGKMDSPVHLESSFSRIAESSRPAKRSRSSG